MSRVAYVNGRYIRHADAAVSIDDRAFLFADGIYEVIEVFGGELFDEAAHLERLARSAQELRLALPVGVAALKLILRELVASNRVTYGHVYLQITRGSARRDHFFPKSGTPATLVAFAHPHERAAAEAKAQKGIKVISLPDIRWKRPDIKSTSLLPNVLAKQQAREAGAYEAWLVDGEGFVTEGASSNAWIVDADGVLVTRPLGQESPAGNHPRPRARHGGGKKSGCAGTAIHDCGSARRARGVRHRSNQSGVAGHRGGWP
jgi:D-alanine transaminase